MPPMYGEARPVRGALPVPLSQGPFRTRRRAPIVARRDCHQQYDDDHRSRRRRRRRRPRPSHRCRSSAARSAPSDVRIDIKFCGICHSDIHFARGEWGEIPYPAVPGHEIAGVVAAVGSDVDRLRGRRPRRRRLHGQLVPRVRELPGRQRAVLHPRQHADLRLRSTATARSPTAATPTTSSSTRTSSLRIPDGLALDDAAPLLCAGITTYSPLRHWNAGPGKQVAVVGLGGLGHMAVKIAARDGRRGHRALAVAAQAGGRAATRRRPLLRDQRRRDVQRARRAAST